MVDRTEYVMTETDQQRIREACALRQFEYHASIGSTNDRALELMARESFEFPALIVAETQTGGRGRQQRRWVSDRGGLWFSWAIDLADYGLAAGDAPRMSVITGLAICGYLAQRWPELDVAMKWPNDVMVNGKKLCGILVEGREALPGRVVIGCGLNLNNTMRDADAELRAKATSVIDEVGPATSPAELLIDLLQFLKLGIALMGPAPAAMIDTWNRFGMHQDRPLALAVGGKIRRGVCRGIDFSGGLVLEENGERSVAMSGSIVDFPAGERETLEE